MPSGVAAGSLDLPLDHHALAARAEAHFECPLLVVFEDREVVPVRDEERRENLSQTLGAARLLEMRQDRLPDVFGDVAPRLLDRVLAQLLRDERQEGGAHVAVQVVNRLLLEKNGVDRCSRRVEVSGVQRCA
jgi:hypothetical protein